MSASEAATVAPARDTAPPPRVSYAAPPDRAVPIQRHRDSLSDRGAQARGGSGALAGGDWFTTRSGILRGEAGWELIAPYADPIARFLARRFPDMNQADRDDILQDVLISM